MPIKDGDIVLINYTIKYVDDDGREVVYTTTREDVARETGLYEEGRLYRPAVIVVGKSKLIDALEEVIRELDVGEKRVVEAEPSKAFGERRPELVIRLPRRRVAKILGRPPRVGDVIVHERLGEGRVVRVLQRFVEVDFNHPLAGKKVIIEVEVVKKATTPEEKLRLLAARWIAVSEDAVEVKVSEDGSATIRIPLSQARLSDLLGRIENFLSDVVDFVEEVKNLEIAFTIDLTAVRSRETSGETGKATGKEAEKEEKTEPEAATEAAAGRREAEEGGAEEEKRG